MLIHVNTPLRHQQFQSTVRLKQKRPVESHNDEGNTKYHCDDVHAVL